MAETFVSAGDVPTSDLIRDFTAYHGDEVYQPSSGPIPYYLERPSDYAAYEGTFTPEMTAFVPQNVAVIREASSPNWDAISGAATRALAAVGSLAGGITGSILGNKVGPQYSTPASRSSSERVRDREQARLNTPLGAIERIFGGGGSGTYGRAPGSVGGGYGGRYGSLTGGNYGWLIIVAVAVAFVMAWRK